MRSRRARRKQLNVDELDDCGEHTPPTKDNHYKFHGADIELEKTVAFESRPCGDKLIRAEDGLGAGFCHENGKLHLLGTIEDAILWIDDELLADRRPECDYRWT